MFGYPAIITIQFAYNAITFGNDIQVAILVMNNDRIFFPFLIEQVKKVCKALFDSIRIHLFHIAFNKRSRVWVCVLQILGEHLHRMVIAIVYVVVAELFEDFFVCHLIEEPNRYGEVAPVALAPVAPKGSSTA